MQQSSVYINDLWQSFFLKIETFYIIRYEMKIWNKEVLIFLLLTWYENFILNNAEIVLFHWYTFPTITISFMISAGRWAFIHRNVKTFQKQNLYSRGNLRHWSVKYSLYDNAITLHRLISLSNFYGFATNDPFNNPFY